MKTIIRITKEEAIEAWKKQNSCYNDTEIIIEIEGSNKAYPDFKASGLLPLQMSTTCNRCGSSPLITPECPKCYPFQN